MISSLLMPGTRSLRKLPNRMISRLQKCRHSTTERLENPKMEAGNQHKTSDVQSSKSLQIADQPAQPQANKASENESERVNVSHLQSRRSMRRRPISKLITNPAHRQLTIARKRWNAKYRRKGIVKPLRRKPKIRIDGDNIGLCTVIAVS